MSNIHLNFRGDLILKDLAKYFVGQVSRNINDEILRCTKEDILNAEYIKIGPLSETSRPKRLRVPLNSRFKEGDEIRIFPKEKYIKIKPYNTDFHLLKYDYELKRLATLVTIENKSSSEWFQKPGFKIGTISRR